MGNVQSNNGSVLGCILLIAGCCTGAGMLGLPVLSASAGFIPSFFLFILCWLFMACTGLLLLEVNLWFKDDVSIISMVGLTLGKIGQAFSWFLYLFLFYSLMVAYIAASGTLFVGFMMDLFGLKISPWIGSLLFTLLFGALVYIGTKAVDEFNRLLMLGLILTYVTLVVMGSVHIQPHLLLHQHWGSIALVIPTMIISFGYHNLIPSLKNYLNGDVRKLRFSILMGSAIPLIVYLLWEALILGMIPHDQFQQSLDNGEIATEALKAVVGSSWIVSVAQYFAFFAIVTSYLAVALGLVDFLADGLSMKKTMQGRAVLCILTVVPPFFFALLYPDIFLSALNYAGAFGAVILFGILPALMVWKGRKDQKQEKSSRLLPGGNAMLFVIILFSLIVVILQAAQEINGGN